MKAIGGYFGLELPLQKKGFIHGNGTMVNSGRNALEYLLLPFVGRITTIWIPYYTCDSILVPFQRLGINYRFYHIDMNLEIAEDVLLGENDLIIANNYFGIKDAYIQSLAVKYGARLIVDNTQSWYCAEIPGVKMFFSPRKFFGVADGGVACPSTDISLDQKDLSWNRFSHLLKRHDEGPSSGYEDFKSNSNELGMQPLKQMSALTYTILSSINFENIACIRRRNFRILHTALSKINRFTIPAENTYSCPMVYPLLVNDGDELRKYLIENMIFVATYWPNVNEWVAPEANERLISANMIPLPIDQRYDEDDMMRIIECLLCFYKG